MATTWTAIESRAMTTSRPETPQEQFWKGEFGNAYSERNTSDAVVRSNEALFADILKSAPGVQSIVELGCNIGQNLQALHGLDPQIKLEAYEINATAVASARALSIANIRHQSILEPDLAASGTFDLSFTKGVLIHIHPDALEMAYKNLFDLSHRYVLVAEYYNPSPVEVTYRGHEARLFKRDFAGEMLDRFDLELIRYGFVYHRDPEFPCDDVSWFLMRKGQDRP